MSRRACIDLGLEVIEALRVPGESLSLQAIADVCGCSQQRIRQIEQRALAKLRRAAAARGLRSAPAKKAPVTPHSDGVPCPPPRYRLAREAYLERRAA